MTDPTPDSSATDRRALLRNALDALRKMEQKLSASEQAGREPIAVIGMGCRLPGGVTTPEEYWELLAEGRDAVSRMPQQRRDFFLRGDPNDALHEEISTPFGGFLEDIDKFDAGFFGISRREAESMDPQQRLLLEVSWEALEHAAIDATTLRGSHTGVFVGVTTTDYSRLTISQDPSDLDAYTATGGALNVTAGRLAYVLGLNGPAMAIDTACSSSLVGIHLACRSLRSGETDLALAAGVNAILLPEPFVCFAKWGMMAPDGHCKTFDEAADGFVRGEGCAVIALKRLSDALEAQDPIWGLIRGSAVNQDGASSGLTVPSGRAQEAVISEALKAAGMSADRIDYIEAHGTGTRLGDPIEVEAIINALRAGRTPDQPLRVGSVKTNIGHLESASGIAGLIKAILSLNHGAIPPHIHFKKLSPQIHIGQFPLDIPVRLTPWEKRSRPRAAGVSSFGFSGTNAHVIVEEAPKRDVSENLVRECEIVCLSARTPSALVQKARDMAAFLAGAPDRSLADFSCASTLGRKHFDHRLAFVAEDTRSLARQLRNWLEGGHSSGVWASVSAEGQAKGTAFLFSGQGARYAGMGKGLYQSEPVFRRVVDRCAEALEGLTDRPLREVLFEEPKNASGETLDAQPALFALEYALSETLREWGIKPTIVMGHGVGEYVAACVAGVFSPEDGLKLIAARARLASERTERGSMVRIFAGEEAVGPIIAGMTEDISIAAFDGPENMVISGRSSSIELAVSRAAASNIGFERLPESHAFHSPLVEPMLDAFLRAASEVVFSPPRISFISSIEGNPMLPGTFPDADHWHRHLREPVRFADSVRALARERCACWLEIGPHPVLLPIAQQAVPDAPESLPTLRQGRPDWTQLTESLAALYSRGWSIDWKTFHAGRSRSSVQLPTYPFEREKFWMAPKTGTMKSIAPMIPRDGSDHPLLGSRLDLPGDTGVSVWQAALDMKRCSFLLDHCIQGSAVFPATAYIEMVLAAMAESQPAEVTVLRDLSFQKPLRVTREARRTLQLWMRKGSDGSFDVKVYSRETQRDRKEHVDGEWTLHMTARASGRRRDDFDIDRETADTGSIRLRCPEEIDGRVFYDGQKQRGNQWGPCFQGVSTLWRGNGEALSEISIPSQLVAELGDYRFHPAVADFSGHVLAATLPVDDAGRRKGAFVGGGISEVRVYASFAGRRLWSHARLRNDSQTMDNVLMGDVRTWDENGDVVAETVGARLWYLDGTQPDSVVDVRDWMYEIGWVPEDSKPDSVRDDLSGQSWIILSDEGGVGETLQSDVTARGGKAALALRGNEYREEGELWRIRPGSFEDFDRCFRSICGHFGNEYSHVVHLWNLDSPASAGMTAEQLRYWQVVGCGSALHTIQAVSRQGQAGARTFFVTAGAQASVEKPCPVSPTQASVWGLGRSAAIEHSKVWGGLIDIEPAASVKTSAALLLQTIESLKSEDQVIFRGGRRLVARLQPLKPHDSRSFMPPIHAAGSYIVTGGLGGIGFETARWLGNEGARRIVIMGRTPLPAREVWDQVDPGTLLGRRIGRMRALEAIGVSVNYLCGDVSDSHLFDLVRDSLEDGSLPPIRGIVHASGVMQYEPLASQNIEALLGVMQAKVIGGWLLHERFLDQPIDFFVLFSSSSSMLNSPFMGGYAAANAFLDSLAAYRRETGLQALGISWGTWSETGMAVDGTRAAGAPLALSKGVGTISNRKGMEALNLLLRWHVVHSGVMPIDWGGWASAYPAFASMPFFSELMKSVGDLPVAGHADSKDQAAQDPGVAGGKDSIVAYLTREIAVVLKTTADRVAVDAPLPTLGFDSLMAVELRTQIERDLGLSVPMVRFLDGPSVRKLAGMLESELASAADGPPSASAPGYRDIPGGSTGDSIGADWEEGAL